MELIGLADDLEFAACHQEEVGVIHHVLRRSFGYGSWHPPMCSNPHSESPLWLRENTNQPIDSLIGWGERRSASGTMGHPRNLHRRRSGQSPDALHTVATARTVWDQQLQQIER